MCRLPFSKGWEVTARNLTRPSKARCVDWLLNGSLVVLICDVLKIRPSTDPTAENLSLHCSTEGPSASVETLILEESLQSSHLCAGQLVAHALRAAEQ